MSNKRIYVGGSLLLGLGLLAANLGAQQNVVRTRTGGSANLVVGPVSQNVAPQASNIGVDDISVIAQPTDDYLGRTTLVEVTAAELATVSSITSGNCTVTFTPPVQVRSVPANWSDWGTPPDTEDSMPRVLYSSASSLTLAFSPGDCLFTTFGFEAEPNPHAPRAITATFFNGSTQVGVITRTIEFGRLFAADAVTAPFSRVVVSGTSDFGVAQLRYSLAPGGVLAGTVRDAGGMPIAGALVRAVGAVTRTATTAADGTYRMLVPGDVYDVTASRFGYLASTASGVQVDEGTTVTQDFTLARDPNTHAISGHVADGGGRALAGITVTVLNTPLAPVTTNANGDYRFDVVPSGTYQVRASGGRCLSTQTQSVTVGASDVVANFTLARAVDAFGYACDDTIAYNWIPGDTLTTLTGDDVSAPFTLPFPFTFYGATYTVLHTCTNGFGNFLGPDTTYVSVCLPKASPPHSLLAPLWDDLLVERPAGIYTRLLGTAPNRQYVIEWRGATFFSGPGSATFELILNESDNSIVYQYNAEAGFGDGRNAVIGIENQQGTVARQYSCKEPVITPNPPAKAIRFYRP